MISRLSNEATAFIEAGIRDEQARASAHSAQVIVQEELPKRESRPQAVMVPPLPSWDVRLNHWVYRQVATTGRVVRMLLWIVMLYPRVRLFASTMVYGFVDKVTYAKRMAECADCDRHLKRIVKTEPELVTKSYCMQCGCPEWALSQLKRKNWFKGWKCPERRHPGPYPEDAYKRFVTVNTPPRKGGCGGG